MIYMQSGQACVTRCDIRGGVWIGGRGANPDISNNRIFGSRNCGVKVTDHAQGQIRGNTIEGCGDSLCAALEPPYSLPPPLTHTFPERRGRAFYCGAAPA